LSQSFAEFRHFQTLYLGLDPFLIALFFSCFAVGNYTQAIECAKTYLLFFPNDEVMSQNLAYYSAMIGEEQASSIGPREVKYLPRCQLSPNQRALPVQCGVGVWAHLPLRGGGSTRCLGDMMSLTMSVLCMQVCIL
jgi:hypothetical protein